jgi:hypothetical protein
MTTVADLLYSSLGPFAADDLSGDLRKFCEALCLPIEIVNEIVGEGEGSPGWSLAFDAANCPESVLPYLAQYVGVSLSPEMAPSQIRAEIEKPTGWERGTDDSIKIATRRTLTGTQWVSIRPNKPEVGKTYIRVLKAECPSATRTETIVRAAVPAWSVLDFEAIDGVTVGDVTASAKWETVADLAAAWSSVQALTEILPSDL